MKRTMLVLLLITMALLLAGCATVTVDSSNSFQNDAPQEVAATQADAPDATQAENDKPAVTPEAEQPTATPSADPAEAGYNG